MVVDVLMHMVSPTVIVDKTIVVDDVNFDIIDRTMSIFIIIHDGRGLICFSIER
jgi:hypothetical protein